MFGGAPPRGLEGEDNRVLLRLGTPLRRAVEWSNDPQTGELAEVGKVYDIRQILLGGLVLIVWCIQL